VEDGIKGCDSNFEVKCSNLQVYLGHAWVKIDIVIENHSVKLLVIVIIDFKSYPSTYCLMQGSCFICSNL